MKTKFKYGVKKTRFKSGYGVKKNQIQIRIWSGKKLDSNPVIMMVDKQLIRKMYLKDRDEEEKMSVEEF